MKKKGELQPNMEIIRKFDQVFKREKSQKRWIWILYISAVSGFIFILTGLYLCGLAYFGAVGQAKTINQIGTWLIFVAFPLIMFSAHCLDKLEAIKKENSKFINK